MRKRRLLLVAGASLATVALTMGTAMADPNPLPPPTHRSSGVGAQTTQGLFDTLCNNNPSFRTNPTDPNEQDLPVLGWWTRSPAIYPGPQRATPTPAQSPDPNRVVMVQTG